MDEARYRAITQLLYTEGRFLDERRWDEWIELYTQTAVYWIPAWDGDNELTDDPQTQISLIYYGSRQGLEDRVYRLRTGQSSASNPMPRTCHIVSNIIGRAAEGGGFIVEASWHCLSHRLGQTTQYFGRYIYELVEADGRLKIARKKIVLLNDRIPTVLDIYSV
jgi:3-phenylpropionate/cinnamic acid dioxygenase small subunit